MSEDVAGQEELLEAVSRWRNQAITRWASVVSNSVDADELRGELADMRDAYVNLLKERDILLEQVEDLRDRLTALVESTSWKLTGPLRWLSGLAARSGGRKR